jgi:hypothetical protein
MPTQSIASSQKKLLESGFLDLSGSSRLEYGPVSFDHLADQLYLVAVQFAETARDNLNKADRVASGALSDSIIPTRVTIFGQIYNCDINVASYYDFVNKGVKGWADEKGGNSPYQFRQFTGKSGKKDSPMITAIKQWILKEGLKGALPINKHPKASIRDRKRSTITDNSLGTAIAISKSIRKKGLKPSHFWDDTVQKITPAIAEQLVKALKLDIITNIIPTNGNRSK